MQDLEHDVSVRVTVDNKNIAIFNSTLKNKEVYSLCSVKKVRSGKGIFCLYTKDKVSILFSDNGFIEGDKKTLFSLIECSKIKKSN